MTAEAKTRAFVETNRQALAKDIARGSGETIVSLTRLAGCKDAATVGQTLQRSYGSIFPSAKVSDRAVSAEVVETLESTPALMCGHIG